MKKVFLIALALAFLSTPALATYGTGTVTLGSTNTMNIQTSNNVYLDYGVQGNGDTFAVATYHDKGTRTYTSSSGDAKIYYKNSTAEPMPSAPAVGSTMNTSGWTAL
ncbi:MAG: hypothetical protein Tsb0017_13240 [Geothermobacteraceae bacterium]